MFFIDQMKKGYVLAIVINDYVDSLNSDISLFGANTFEVHMYSNMHLKIIELRGRMKLYLKQNFLIRCSNVKH